MPRSRLTALFVLVVLTIPLIAAAPAAPAPSRESWTCQVRGVAMTENSWLGGTGDWTNGSQWSEGHPPLSSTRVCIDGASSVTLGPAAGRVDLAGLVLGQGATLKVTAGAELYLGNSRTDFSLVRSSGRLDVNGGTVGGPGTLLVRGDLRLQPDGDTRAQLATGSDTVLPPGDGGRLVIDFQGLLEITGAGASGLRAGYAVTVFGHSSIAGDGSLAADHGTSFTLDRALGRPTAGELELENDQGYGEVDGDTALPLSAFENHGLITKTDGSGVSRIAADYSASDGALIQVDLGSLVLPDGTFTEAVVAPGATYGTGVCDQAGTDCGTGTTEERPQLATLTVPPGADTAAEVLVTQLPGTSNKYFGSAIKAHASNLDVSRIAPAVIELRYDAALLVAGGMALGWRDLEVGHSDDGGKIYDDLVRCTKGGDVPAPADACVDRSGTDTSSRNLDDGDVVMVVHTIDTSRWIVH